MGALAFAGIGLGQDKSVTKTESTGSFSFCLNTGTIRGFKLNLLKEIEVASKAGYQAIEPWVENIDACIKSGTPPAEIRQRIVDAGLTVESAIGFPEWIVDDEARRAKGMERAKREWIW